MEQPEDHTPISTITTRQILRNWTLVFLGNIIASALMVGLMFATRQNRFGGGEVGLTALTIANAKAALGFGQALALGIGCNLLVCLAMWLCFSARTTTDRICSIIFPVTA